MQLLYFAVYNVHPRLCVHYVWDYVIIISMHNVYLYFSFKNFWGKSAHYTWQNTYGTVVAKPSDQIIFLYSIIVSLYLLILFPLSNFLLPGIA